MYYNINNCDKYLKTLNMNYVKIIDNMFNFKNTYTKLPNCFFYNQNIKKVVKPELVIFNKLLSQ